MLVFGDPKFSAPLSELFETFRARVRRMTLSSLDDLRSLLIFAGQLEQAVSDRANSSAVERKLEAASLNLTNTLANLFCRKFISGKDAGEKGAIIAALDRMAETLASAPALGRECVTAKIPEGYAFYALFPEQYCMTTLNWARQHPQESEALVVGIRSIGTSLSAVVKETLCLNGVRASRFTVRPGGHPFQRQLTLDAISIDEKIPLLIVDEGPGISGSSMATVAEAFSSIGCRNVFFLPGHRNDPSSGSPNIMEIWRRVPRLVTSIEEVKWSDLSLEDSLLAHARKFVENISQCESIQNVSAGLWQKCLPAAEVEWPTSPPQFERLKYLCRGPEGSSVLWKFIGLHSGSDGADASEKVLARLSRLASAGYCPQPLGTFRGFVGLPWIEGVRLTRAAANDASLLHRIGNYIVDAAQPPLAPWQSKIAIERIAEMLHWNTKESLGEDFAQLTKALAEVAFDAGDDLGYGDGHLAPHEWIRAADGTIYKLDAEGHSADHTLVGEQSVLWDIAGACVEWDLNSQAAALFFDAIEAREVRVNLDALAFYRAAYAAFRVGLFSLGISQIADEQEKARFAKGRAFYLKQLAHSLKAEAATVQSAG
jgi:hypothetical protein